MKTALTTVLIASLLMSTATVMGQAPTDKRMSVQVSFREEDVSQLNGGRLPQETAQVVYRVIAVVTVPQLTFCMIPIEVDFSIKGRPAYATPTISPSSVTRAVSYSGQEGIGPLTVTGKELYFETRLTISTSRQAPALADGVYQVQADASAGTTSGGSCTLAPGTGKGMLAIKNDYRAQASLLDAHRDGADVSLTLENFANGPSRFRFAYLTKDGLSEESSRVLHLESTATHGSSAVKIGTVILDHQERPAHWSGKIRIHQSYDGSISGGTPSTNEMVLSV